MSKINIRRRIIRAERLVQKWRNKQYKVNRKVKECEQRLSLLNSLKEKHGI